MPASGIRNSAVPEAGAAQSLHSAFQLALLDRYRRTLADLGEALGIDDSSEALPHVPRRKVLSPVAYASLWRLTHELESGNNQGVADCVLALEKHAFVREPRQTEVRPFGSSDVDDAAIHFVFGPDGPRSPTGAMPTMASPAPVEFKSGEAGILSSVDQISLIDPDLADEFAEYVADVRLFDGSVIRGMTSVRFFGTIYLRCPDIDLSESERLVYFVDHLTHETSHLHLHSLMLADPMVRNSDDERFPAPIRADDRPIFGIFHATFVLSRIVRVFARWVRSGTEVAAVYETLDRSLGRFHQGKSVLHEHADLTERGKQVLESAVEMVDRECGGLLRS